MKFCLAACAAIALATLTGCQITCTSLPLDPTCGSPMLDPTCGSPMLDPTCGSPDFGGTGCSSNFAPVVSSASASGVDCGSGGCSFGISGGGHSMSCPRCGIGVGAGGCGSCGLALPGMNGGGVGGLIGGVVTAPLAAVGIAAKPPCLASNLVASGLQQALQGTPHGQQLMQRTAQGCANGWCNRPMGPESGGQMQWPYYTVRGPRDFFLDKPPTIGP